MISNLASLFQDYTGNEGAAPGAVAPAYQAYAQPQVMPQQQQSSALQSLLPGFDLSRAGDPGYMAQFRNPALSGGMGPDGMYVDNNNSLYAAKGSDGNMYDLNYTGNGLNLTSHYGAGDAGGGTYNQYGLDGNLLSSNQFKNYSHNVRDAVGMSAMVLGGAAAAGMGAAGAGAAAGGASSGAGAVGPGMAGWGADLGTSMGTGLSAGEMGAAGAGGAGAIGSIAPSMPIVATDVGAGAGVGAGVDLGTAAGAGAGGLGSTISNALSNQAVRSGISAAASGILGNGSGGGTGGLGGLIAGGYDAYKQNQAANNMLDYMRTQQAKIDSIYSPDGPLAKTMYGQMSAQDAAAGRNSQYGTRTTDFLGKFGGEYARNTAALTQGLAGNYQQAFNQQASAGTGVATAAGKFLNSPAGQGLVQNVGSYLGNTPGSQMSSSNNDTWAQGWSNALRTGQNGAGDNIYG